MDELRTFIDGRKFLTNSPFRSGYFLTITLVALGTVAVDVYILWRHWKILPFAVIVALGVQIGVQTVYQWWRSLRYYSKIRRLHVAETRQDGNAEPPQELALRAAVGGMTDILFYSSTMTFYSSTMTLIALLLIASTLMHLEGIR